MTSPTGMSIYTKDGFSWPAFFFGPMWALVKRDWRDFFVLFGVFGVLVFIDERWVKPSMNLFLLLMMLALYLTYMVVCGRNGNGWLRKSLERRGYSRSINMFNSPGINDTDASPMASQRSARGDA